MAIQNIDVAKEASVQSVLSAVNDGFANMTSSTSSSSMNKTIFIYTGTAQTFVVPEGITEIYITASGGGGSGTGTYYSGNIIAGQAGGSTIIGSLVTLAGGKGGTTSAGGAAGGTGGGVGSTGEIFIDSAIAGGGSAWTPAGDGLIGRGGDGQGAGGGSLGGGGGSDPGAYASGGSNTNYFHIGGKGGKSALGFGDGQDGSGRLASSYPMKKAAGDGGLGGGGGAGARGQNSSSIYLSGYGGGGAAAIFRNKYSVTPGQSISITVGKGGSNMKEGFDSNKYWYCPGGDGGDGIVIIEW